MTAARLQSAIAAGLSNPTLLKDWSARPQELKQAGIDVETLDFHAIRKFAGLGCKVRHNELRRELPLSFRFVKAAGIEIDFFAAYAEHLAESGKTLAKTKEERADGLLLFANKWLDRSDRKNALFWDVLQHEMAIFAAKHRAQQPASEKPAPSGLNGHSVMRTQGTLQLRILHFNPADIAQALQAEGPEWEAVPPANCLMGYWRANDGQAVHVMELDALSFEVLRLLDGNRSLDDISMLLLDEAASPAFLSSVQQLATLDLNGDGSSIVCSA